MSSYLLRPFVFPVLDTVYSRGTLDSEGRTGDDRIDDRNDLASLPSQWLATHRKNLENGKLELLIKLIILELTYIA